MVVEMQFRQVCTAEANVVVHVVLQSEGGFFCVWKTIWHSFVHYGSYVLKALAEREGAKTYKA